MSIYQLIIKNTEGEVVAQKDAGNWHDRARELFASAWARVGNKRVTLQLVDGDDVLLERSSV